MGENTTFIGLDVHKETITVALADSGERGEVRENGRIANSPEALKGLLGKLKRVGRKLRFCYEAGPCGYGIQRQLTAAEHGSFALNSAIPGRVALALATVVESARQNRRRDVR